MPIGRTVGQLLVSLDYAFDQVVYFIAALIELIHRERGRRLEEDELQDFITLEHDEFLENLGCRYRVVGDVMSVHNLLTIKFCFELLLKLLDIGVMVLF